MGKRAASFRTIKLNGLTLTVAVARGKRKDPLRVSVWINGLGEFYLQKPGTQGRIEDLLNRVRAHASIAEAQDLIKALEEFES